MKTKLNYILFAMIILLNFSCTNDDDQEVTTVTKIEKKVDLNKSAATMQTPEDGEPSNPKTK